MSSMIGFALVISSFALAAVGIIGYTDCLNSGYSEVQCLCVAVAGGIGALFIFGLALYEMFLADGGSGGSP